MRSYHLTGYSQIYQKYICIIHIINLYLDIRNPVKNPSSFLKDTVSLKILTF